MVRIALLILFLILPICAQSPYKETYEKQFLDSKYPQKVPVLFRPYPVWEGENKYAVYLVADISYGYLQFILRDGRYAGDAQIEVAIQDRKQSISKTRIWETGTSTEHFRETTDAEIFHTTWDSLRLPPGNYELLMTYRDLNGQRQLALTRKLSLPESEGRYQSPPLFFFPENGQTGFANAPEPNISPMQGIWDFNKDLGIYLRTDLAEGMGTMRVKTTLVNSNTGAIILSDEQSDLSGPVIPLSYVVPAAKLQEGPHRLKVISYFGADSTRTIVPFKVIWFDKPKSMWDKNLSLWPLRHILEESDYKNLQSGNREEQQEKLKAFWAGMDRTPETPFNELQQEFYARVDTTLIRYASRRKQGWETDPGKIFIAMGPPDQVDDHSLDPGPEPYLRWTYNRDGKKMVYTFLAVDGRKEYKLIDATEAN